MASDSETRTPKARTLSSLAFESSLEGFRFTPSPRNSPRKRAVVETEVGVIDDALPVLEGVGLRRSSRRVSKRAVALSPSPTYDDPPSKPQKRKKAPSDGTPNGSSSKKPKRGFAPPEQYAHLNFLQDILKEDLDVMFCGINPGCMSAEIGHHFANPTNHFWKCLHRSGFTDCLLPASEDFTISDRFNLGLTNLVDRPSAEQAELSTEDMKSGVPALLFKVARLRPHVVCFVGKGIWEIFRKEVSRLVHDSLDVEVQKEVQEPARPKGSKRKRSATKRLVFSWGVQPMKTVHTSRGDGVRETIFFVMPSTSGRVISHQLPDKVKLFVELRERVAAFKNGDIQTKDMVVIPLPTLGGIRSVQTLSPQRSLGTVSFEAA